MIPKRPGVRIEEEQMVQGLNVLAVENTDRGAVIASLGEEVCCKDSISCSKPHENFDSKWNFKTPEESDFRVIDSVESQEIVSTSNRKRTRVRPAP